jgi:hypothetical protein
MSVACVAEVCERFLWEGDTSHPKLPACHSGAALDSTKTLISPRLRTYSLLGFST